MKRWDFNPSNLFNWIVAFCIFKIPLTHFYRSISEEGDYARRWFSEFNIWSVLLQNSTYALCGIILATYLMEYFKIEKNLINFIFVYIIVQITGDVVLSVLVNQIPYSSKWTTFFKGYANTSGLNALIGHTLFALTWVITYHYVSEYIESFALKAFIVLFFLFLVSAYSI